MGRTTQATGVMMVLLTLTSTKGHWRISGTPELMLVTSLKPTTIAREIDSLKALVQLVLAHRLLAAIQIRWTLV